MATLPTTSRALGSKTRLAYLAGSANCWENVSSSSIRQRTANASFSGTPSPRRMSAKSTLCT
ncbi:MAG: hypothetical protein HY712_07260 [candidate division NC10 bacterium]|nr:hypothetical protein [candidate division NC10 bacterium]